MRIPDFKIRLPQELKTAIEEAAKANNRSMNGEIVARLEQSLMLSRRSKVRDADSLTISFIEDWEKFKEDQNVEIENLKLRIKRLEVTRSGISRKITD